MKKVWVNGCFDVLHRGHVELLQYAKSQGDQLVVGIDFDERVKAAKGETRPFNTFKDRKFLLESLECVDKVVGFGTDFELRNCIEREEPYCMIVGSDWEGKNVIGREHVKMVHYFSRIGDYSTTKILEKK
ncbi:adenylyltransferase/cytidyltransferase family protein [bacterium]|nr:adenylyltransferase/cytidyltransferase family protein [bacterium]